MEGKSKEDEQRANIAKLIDDPGWTHFVILTLRKDDGGIISFRRKEDGAIVRPLTELEDLRAVQGGMKAFFKKDLDALMLFLGIVTKAVRELKEESGWMPPEDGAEA